jgi:quinol monooxygenase YgiN
MVPAWVIVAILNDGLGQQQQEKTMIIVFGSVTVREDALEQAITLSHSHVTRSRNEPGCISHAVHIDSENSNRLVFVEHWQDMGSLEKHFQVPESGEFIQAMAELAVVAPELKMYQADEITRH